MVELVVVSTVLPWKVSHAASRMEGGSVVVVVAARDESSQSTQP